MNIVKKEVADGVYILKSQLHGCEEGAECISYTPVSDDIAECKNI